MDSSYTLECAARAHDEFMEDNSRSDAITTLSKFGFNYFMEVLLESNNYDCTELVRDEASSILRKGAASVESARIVRDGVRCNCPKQKEFDSMCPHEACKHKRKFVKELFSIS